MNFIVIDSEHLEEDFYLYQGAEARELIQQHDLKSGIQIAGILYNQGQGIVKVLEVSKDRLKLSYQKNKVRLSKAPISLIVGICRPQTVKKVLQLSLALGVQELIFINSGNSEKSYLSSKIWDTQQLKHEMSLGMAQSGDYLAPEIKIYKKFTDFVDFYNSSAKYQEANKFLASTNKQEELVPQAFEHSLLAIGPEKGWLVEEEACFLQLGFQGINFGERILRVEQAVAYGLGKLS